MSPAVARRRRPALCIGKPFPFTTIRLKLQQRSDFKGRELRGKCKYSELEGAEPMPKESGYFKTTMGDYPQDYTVLYASPDEYLSCLLRELSGP